MKTIHGEEFNAYLMTRYLLGYYGTLVAERDGIYAEDGSLSIHEDATGTFVRVYTADGSVAGERFLTLALSEEHSLSED